MLEVISGCRTLWSNPSIERTCQRPLRALWPAAHVERWAPEARPVLGVALSSPQAVVRPSKIVNVRFSCGAQHAIARAGRPSVGGRLTAVGARRAEPKTSLLRAALVEHQKPQCLARPSAALVRAVRPSAASGRPLRLARKDLRRPSLRRRRGRVTPGCRLGARSGSRLAAAAHVVSILAMRAIPGIATLWPNPSIERTF